MLDQLKMSPNTHLFYFNLNEVKRVKITRESKVSDQIFIIWDTTSYVSIF